MNIVKAFSCDDDAALRFSLFFLINRHESILFFILFNMKKSKKFLYDGLLLTATALIMRTVGVVFNAYVSERIGESGMGLFTLVMSVYTFAVTFATSGINLAATRMTAEAIGHENEREIRDAMKRCIDA